MWFQTVPDVLRSVWNPNLVRSVLPKKEKKELVRSVEGSLFFFFFFPCLFFSLIFCVGLGIVRYGFYVIFRRERIGSRCRVLLSQRHLVLRNIGKLVNSRTYKSEKCPKTK